MSTHVDCIACIVSKADRLANKYIQDKKKKHDFMKKVLQAIIQTDYERSAPYLDAKFFRIIKDTLGTEDLYKEEKRFFNDKLLSMESEIEALLATSQDPLADALKIALAGNIIDFSALKDIDLSFVQTMIHRTLQSPLDETCFARLKKDLEEGQDLLYLGDNAGEIVLDKIFIKQIKRQFPHLTIRFATRQKPIFNDVTEEDAYAVGINDCATIINNGTDIPGTDLLEVSSAFKSQFEKAYTIIAKGQGNYESLSGCGSNIYYLFLCKCDMLMERLRADRYANMFICEKQ